MMTRTVLETWEELPIRTGDARRFDLTAGPIFVVHAPVDRPPDAIWFQELAAELGVKHPDSTLVLLPEGWCFRVVRYEGEEVPT
jgi:hypothetical protein